MGSTLHFLACSSSQTGEGELSQILQLQHLPVSYMLHARCIILHRRSKTTLLQTQVFPLFFTFLPLREKESYRKCYHNTTSNNHTCYTIHIQPTLETSYLDKTHTSPYTFFILLLFDMRRRAIAKCDRQHLRIYHACYTTHIQSIFEN